MLAMLHDDPQIRQTKTAALAEGAPAILPALRKKPFTDNY